ncbi:MAG TPA: hypothetical protein VMW47_04480 [Verrucomicrobiae bacterium]|nr:hypothetical protein [Verrucomicrobiae bacterium]
MWTARRACAKVNLALEVLGRRADGFHDLAAVSQTIDWGDLVAVERGPVDPLSPVPSDDPRAWVVIVTGELAPALATDHEPNLVARAGLALARAGHAPVGGRIWLVKRVPVGSGLGGGSADAAAALRLLSPGLPEPELARLGLTLGADVPFALLGGTARLAGVGERLEPLPPPPPSWCVIAVLGRVLTAAVYRTLTPADHTSGERVARVAGALRSATAIDPDWLGSGLEPGAWRAQPALARAAGRLRAATHPTTWALTGSGGAYFSLEPDRERAVGLVEAARAAVPQARVRLARTVGPTRPMPGSA